MGEIFIYTHYMNLYTFNIQIVYCLMFGSFVPFYKYDLSSVERCMSKYPLGTHMNAFGLKPFRLSLTYFWGHITTCVSLELLYVPSEINFFINEAFCINIWSEINIATSDFFG